MCTPRGADPCPYASHPRGTHLHPKQGCTVCTLHGVHTCTLWGAYLYLQGCLFVPLAVLICTLWGTYLYPIGCIFVTFRVLICTRRGTDPCPYTSHPRGSHLHPIQGCTRAPYIGVHKRTLWGAYLYPLGCLYTPIGVQTLVPIQATLGVQICTSIKLPCQGRRVCTCEGTKKFPLGCRPLPPYKEPQRCEYALQVGLHTVHHLEALLNAQWCEQHSLAIDTSFPHSSSHPSLMICIPMKNYIK